MPRKSRLLTLIEKAARRVYPGYPTDKTDKLLEWSIQKFRLLNRDAVKRNRKIYRGEIFWCDLGENVGSEESKRRPCVIIQNQMGNDFAPTTIVAPITNTNINLPVAVPLARGNNPAVTGTIDLGQIRVISKGRLQGDSIAKLTNAEMKAVDNALMKSLGVYGYVIQEQKKYAAKDTYARGVSNKLKHAQGLLDGLQNELGVVSQEDLLKAVKTLKGE